MKSVKNIKKITKAMKMVAASKLRAIQVREENSHGLGQPYTALLGDAPKFADSWEEFKTQKLGAAQNCSATIKGNHMLTDDILPIQKDWREDGIVSPVKDQGHCGSSWTFSTTGALEAAYKQGFGKDISLSKQQLVDCAGAFNNFGCHGGLPSQAFEYIKFIGGLETEEAYPYWKVDAYWKVETTTPTYRKKHR